MKSACSSSGENGAERNDLTHGLNANLAPATATREIDRVLSEVREHKPPGSLLIATDVARFPAEPPTTALLWYTGGASPQALSLFTKAATELIGDHHVTVLADLLVHRLQAVPQQEWSGLPVLSTAGVSGFPADPSVHAVVTYGGMRPLG